MTNVVALQDARPAWNYTLADAAADINRKFDELTEAHRRVAKAQDRIDSAKRELHGMRFAVGEGTRTGQTRPRGDRQCRTRPMKSCAG